MAKKKSNQRAESKSELTGPAVGIGITLFAFVLAFYPSYLSLASNSIETYVFLGIAAFVFLIGFLGFLYEAYKAGFFETFWQLLRGLTGNQDAWTNAAILIFFLVSIALVHFITIFAFGITGIVAVAIKFALLIPWFFAAIALAATIDEFFIKPRIDRKETITYREKQARNKQIGKLGAILLWVITTLSTFLQLIDQFYKL